MKAVFLVKKICTLYFCKTLLATPPFLPFLSLLHSPYLQAKTCVKRIYLVKLFLIHAFLCEPMKESFPFEHCDKLELNPFKQFLNGGIVSNKRSRHLHFVRRHITNGNLCAVGNPVHKITRIVSLHARHLLLYFFHRNFAPKHGCVG